MDNFGQWEGDRHKAKWYKIPVYLSGFDAKSTPSIDSCRRCSCFEMYFKAKDGKVATKENKRPANTQNFN